MTGHVKLYALVAALLAGAGAYLIYSSALVERRTVAPSPGRLSARQAMQRWLRQAGLGEVSIREFLVTAALLYAVGAVAGYLLFDSVVASVIAGLLVGSFPASAYRRRRQQRIEAAAETWPQLLEEMRLHIGALGSSVPQALFESARRAPDEWKPAFAAAEREWLLATDFAATVGILKDRIADPTADAVCETLLLAHELGGTDIESKLAELIDDRSTDLHNRKDAVSRQAGVRFARRFVLIVPLGMALAGLTIGTGRQAYASTGGQVAVAVGLLAVAACWVWAGRLMRLPKAPRVFG